MELNERIEECTQAIENMKYGTACYEKYRQDYDNNVHGIDRMNKAIDQLNERLDRYERALVQYKQQAAKRIEKSVSEIDVT